MSRASSSSDSAQSGAPIAGPLYIQFGGPQKLSDMRDLRYYLQFRPLPRCPGQFHVATPEEILIEDLAKITHGEWVPNDTRAMARDTSCDRELRIGGLITGCKLRTWIIHQLEHMMNQYRRSGRTVSNQLWVVRFQSLSHELSREKEAATQTINALMRSMRYKGRMLQVWEIVDATWWYYGRINSTRFWLYTGSRGTTGRQDIPLRMGRDDVYCEPERE